MIQIMTAITAITINIPTPTPAWKISPISSQLVSVKARMTMMAEKSEKRFMASCF